MAWIRCVEDGDATGDLAGIYGNWLKANPSRPGMPAILKCFSARPDFLKLVMDFSYSLHFADGFLNRRTKEMIATFVSGLNRCPY